MWGMRYGDQEWKKRMRQRTRTGVWCNSQYTKDSQGTASLLVLYPCSMIGSTDAIWKGKGKWKGKEGLIEQRRGSKGGGSWTILIGISIGSLFPFVCLCMDVYMDLCANCWATMLVYHAWWCRWDEDTIDGLADKWKGGMRSAPKTNKGRQQRHKMCVVSPSFFLSWLTLDFVYANCLPAVCLQSAHTLPHGHSRTGKGNQTSKQAGKTDRRAEKQEEKRREESIVNRRRG